MHTAKQAVDVLKEKLGSSSHINPFFPPAMQHPLSINIEPYRTYLIWIPPFSNLHYPLKSMGILSSINGGLFRQIEGPSTVNMSTFRREFFIGKTGLFVGDLETAK